ncbi:putative inactive carboxylesterase 4 [Branchiostoma lanceolatum]|uniref:putative inactive carboxylesterase 4 n=1 Tax=Branchiostoma lanceolatum TaxID=7740 RepID=UPI0034535357
MSNSGTSAASTAIFIALFCIFSAYGARGGAFVWRIFDHENISTSEDCLNLNVYTHNVSVLANQPVMVWIHGGGFTEGTASSYPGEVLAARHNVVLVTFNYRLGDFAFLPTLDKDAPGNFGFLDQLTQVFIESNLADIF